MEIALKKGIWKWQHFISLRLKKVSWVALKHTTDEPTFLLVKEYETIIKIEQKAVLNVAYEQV